MLILLYDEYQEGYFVLESDYPYIETDCDCQFTSKPPSDVQISDEVQVEENETIVKEAVAEVGALCIAIDASHLSFQLYSYGIYDPLFC